MLPETMTAAVLHGPRDLRIEQCATPPVGAGDVAVRVHVCGICGTDLHYWDGWEFDAWFPPHPDPWVPGHEFTGTVVAVGEGVQGLSTGARVVVEPATPCGECDVCERGYGNFCPRRRGLYRGGAWAEYVIVSHHNVVALPDGVDPVLASMSEPLGCVLRGFDRISTRAGDHVFIAGAGPIGLMALQVAKHMGAAHTIISEPHPSRRLIAQRLGADAILDPTREDVSGAVRDLTRGLGADLAIEAAGANPALQACLDNVRDSGTILVLSVGNPDTTFQLRPFDLFGRELRIVGSNTRLNTFKRALDLIPVLDLAPLATHHFPLADAVTAVRQAKSGDGGKIMIHCDGEIT